MRVGLNVRLDVVPSRLDDLDAYLLAQLKGLSVLDVGAAGDVWRILPDPKTWRGSTWRGIAR